MSVPVELTGTLQEVGSPKEDTKKVAPETGNSSLPPRAPA
jgi:hypothetical protein